MNRTCPIHRSAVRPTRGSHCCGARATVYRDWPHAVAICEHHATEILGPRWRDQARYEEEYWILGEAP